MKTVVERVDALKPELAALIREIHDNPEVGYQEYKAVELQAAILEKCGFTVEKGVAGLDTAYRAVYKGAKDGPRVGYLAEYDALEGMGHACGHNMIAGVACGCAIALKDAVDEFGGEVVVVGAPAEETDGGKVILSKAGLYDDLDVAMMAHPLQEFARSGKMYAIQPLQFEFYGRESHAAAEPEKGINALDGVLQLFTAINALREHVRSTVRMHGIVKHGGDAANIVPGYACAQFYIRDASTKYLQEVVERVKKCAEGAAACTGTEVKITEFENAFDSVVTNETLSARATEHLKSEGIGVDCELPVENSSGSSDFGNVSSRCPAMHAWFDVTGDLNIGPHMQEFTTCTASDYAVDNMIKQIKALVMTGEDVLTQPEFLAEIKEEFKKAIG